MKILFIYPESGYNTYNNISFKNGRYYPGIGVLSALLKKMGHKTFLHHILFNFDPKNLKNCIEEVKPDLIMLTSTTHMMSDIIKIDRFLYSNFSNIKVIAGGMLFSMEPELIYTFKSIDAIIAGDGEIAIEKIIQNIEKKEKNIYYNVSNAVTRENFKGLEDIKVECVENIDSLPFGDRDIFNYKEIDDYKWFKRLNVFTSRGCVFSCPFCANSVLKKYFEPGIYMRWRSPQNIVQEIKENINKYPEIESIQFQSDLFFKNKLWLKEFVKIYSREVKLPYHCLMRIEQVDEEVATLLKESGCELVIMGVESGSSSLREKYGKESKQKKILRAFRIIKEKKIKIGTFNIMGLPGENIDSILSSIKINALISPDMAQISIYYPYKNTELYKEIEFMIDKEKDHCHTYFERSLLKDRYLVEGFDYYYKNFLKFATLLKNKKNFLSKYLLLKKIKKRKINEEFLNKFDSDIFRIIF